MSAGVFKWAVASGLMGLALLFTQCGKPFEDKGDLIYSVDGVMVPMAGADAQSSLDAFQVTVYPLTRQYCVACHGAGQQPLHADSDPEKAHNALLAQYKVNFSDPSASRIVRKLRDESHHCWTSCSAAAQSMQEAVEEWAQLMVVEEDEGPRPDELPGLVTGSTQTLQQERQVVTNGAVIYTAPAAGAMLTAPMVLRTTSSPAYAEAPNDGNNQALANNDASAGVASFTFSATQARTGGALWGLVNAAPDDDSFHIRMNNGGFAQWNLNTTAGQFRWVRMPNNHNIVAGTNTVTVREREDGAQISMVLWTQDQALVPGGLGTAGQITLRFPLDALLGVAGVSLEVKIEDYDGYSYRLSALRLNNSSGRDVYVKNLRVLVNGTYNPQHSNYTLVDQLVMNGGSALTPANMIVLKDKGESGDRFSFAFEALEMR